jgi:prepilin-type N-terminal cleavage/methylation domain-containing protein
MRIHPPILRAKQSAARAGFTLFEIMIVLGLLAMMIAISWPAIAVIQAEYQLRQGGQLVQAKLASARLHAVESGFDYQFCYEPGGQRFIVLPYDSQALLAQPAAGTRAPHKAGGKLPSAKAHFDGGSSVSAPMPGSHGIPSEWLNGMADAGEYSGATWSAPVVFHPDGSASAAVIHVVDKKSRQVTVTVRPLTGAVTVSKIHSGGTR